MTIVVMIILLGVTITGVINGGLFEAAGGAVGDTNNKVAQQQDRVDELMGVLTEVEQDQCTHEWGEWEIIKEATEEEKGLKRRTCTKNCGKIEEVEIPKKIKLVIGAYIEGYNPAIGEYGEVSIKTYESQEAKNGHSNQSFRFTASDNIKWRVIGQENGGLIITTADPVVTTAGSNYYLQGQAGYVNFIDELNKISGIYGQGKYADISKFTYTIGEGTAIQSGGRSLKLEDLDCTVKAETPETCTMNSEGYVLDSEGQPTSYSKFVYWGEDVTPSERAKWCELNKENKPSVTLTTNRYTSGTNTAAIRGVVRGRF